jgi:hypothetical protein
MRSRLAVVSFLANDAYTPRGVRTKALIEALQRDWLIELHSSKAMHAAPDPRAAVRSARRTLAHVRKATLLDNQEPWSFWNFRRWRPQVDGALLIGWPMSPVAYAAARLRSSGIPYVVDVGDPWVLTEPNPWLRRPVIARAARAEGELWSGASGAVLTTRAQADAISSLYPSLPILIRPNGYDGAGGAGGADAALTTPADRPSPAGERISLVNFGTLSSVLLDAGALLGRLIDSGRWREVSFAQYGHAWPGMLEHAPPQAIVSRHEPVPWSEALRLARDHDAALVIGTRDAFRMRMPSKAAQYLTLPVPRVAITCGADDDALSDYLSDKPGWLCCAIDDPNLGERIQAHVTRPWSAEELAAPRDESWPSVAGQIAEFVNRALSNGA